MCLVSFAIAKPVPRLEDKLQHRSVLGQRICPWEYTDLFLVFLLASLHYFLSVMNIISELPVV